MGPQHLFILLQPFQGKLPQTDAQFRELCTQLRRYGHIVENAPGNIGNQLTGAPRQARPGAYLAQSMGAYLTQSGSTLDTATFLSGAQDGQAGNSADPLSQSLLQQQHDPFASWQQDGICGEHSLDAYHAAARSAGSANPFVSAMPPDLTGTYAAVPTADGMDDDEDSSSMTSSDNGSETLDMPDLSRMNDKEAAEQLFYQYRKAKRTWRRFTGKLVRRFRRDFKRNFYKRGKGKGHPRGRGRGHSRGFFYTNDDVQVFLKGRGKGHR